MSYCPKCGVELAPSEERCPLCKTPAPQIDAVPVSEKPYPPAPNAPDGVRTPRKRRTFAAACAILLLIPVLTCVVCDLNMGGTLTWARYVLLSFALLYIYLFPPMVLLRHRLLISIPLDCVGTMGFLWGLERLTGGDWFLPFGLPLTVLVFGVLLAVVLLVRKSPWNLLKILAAILCGMGVFVVALEWLINRSFYPGRQMTWAVYTCIPCLLLGAALFVIDRNPACKQELRKRFFV